VSEFWLFCNNSPFLSLVMIIFAGCSILAIVQAPFLIVNRICRTRNVKNSGWPPVHLDADGDFKGE